MTERERDLKEPGRGVACQLFEGGGGLSSGQVTLHWQLSEVKSRRSYDGIFYNGTRRLVLIVLINWIMALTEPGSLDQVLSMGARAKPLLFR